MFVLEGNREFAGKNLVSFASGEVKELTAELFAKYLEGLSTLTLDPGEGALPAGDPGTRTIYYGEAIGTLPTPTRDYYDFDGWYTAASGGTKVTSSSTFTGDVTLYAHWTIHIPSDWVLASQVPSGAQVVERKYSYTKRDYTESSSSSISGWTWYDTRRTGWGSWSDWLTWDPTNGERNVESRSVYDHTNYHYYRWTSPSHNAIYTYETSDYNCHTLEEDWFTYELPVSSRGYPVVYNGTDNWANRWVPANYAGNYSVDKTFTQDVYRTEWRYQDPVYTYYFYKDSNLESPSYPSGSDISNIQEWVRYRAK
ncbi:MAG: InlB B-repeat-containing protein [Oscillospiraceae bacterium]|nr:InlB B-repeat-containing protein [Oscillospiraceae bacterium]